MYCFFFFPLPLPKPSTKIRSVLHPIDAKFALVRQGFSVFFEEIALFHPFRRNTFSAFSWIVTASNYSLIYEGSIVRTFSATAVNTLCKISIISVSMCPASKPTVSEFKNYFWLLFF